MPTVPQDILDAVQADKTIGRVPEWDDKSNPNYYMRPPRGVQSHSGVCNGAHLKRT
jgi:hypothetical protein